jgi:hypothetical protein
LETLNLESVPPEYHDFADVFSKARADQLTPHHPYDLKINLAEGTEPPLRPMYSLSQSELQTLWEWIDENLASGFICLSSSLHGTLILFIKKKDGLLHLCINFCGLNQITKKDHYPLLLTTDLLDAPCKAQIYTKIDLHHTYHLVWISKGDEWKATF